MKSLLLVGAIVLLAGCAAPTPPPAAVQPVRPTQPRIVHRLLLVTPPGAAGTIELRQEFPVQGGVVTPIYKGYGGIVVTDDVAQWRFAYTKTSLEGPGPAAGEWLDGLHAMSVILTNVTAADLEIEWDRSSFQDASGRRQRMIHRGIQLNQRSAPMLATTLASGAVLNEFIFPADGITFSAPGRSSIWNSPAVFERLTPGNEFSIVLAVRSASTVADRTFRFSVVPPPAPTPAAPR
jgi:hypothetical protein